MKQTILLFFFILGLPFIGQAKEITRQEAIRIAIAHGKAICGEHFPSQVQKTQAVQQEGRNAYYIIQFQPEGWALIAADDQATPVIGYSPTGTYATQDQPETMQWWLEGQAKHIRRLSDNKKQRRHDGWDNLPVHTRAIGKIEPLIQVKWNQSAPYNKYCPQNAKGKRSIVGCVAVAMAQAMTIYQQPQQGKGKYNYETNAEYGIVGVNFDKEAPYDWDAILAGTNNYDEAARLLFHCGIIVNMDYTAAASGAYTQKIPAAMKTYFNYNENMRMVNRNSYSGDWIELILNELVEGRPIIYNGTNDLGTSAHAFNLDGFDGSSSFHINWGWGGQNNGFFTLENLNDGNFNYLKNHGAIVNFIPKDFVTANTAIDANAPARVYTDAGLLYIDATEKGKYQVYSISGRMVANGSFSAGSQEQLNAQKLSPSIYLLRLQYGERVEVQKVVIH